MSVRVGFVGCGWWATVAHLPVVSEHPQAEIAAIAESDPARLNAAGDDFGVSARFADATAMLDAVELDAVVVATSNVHHYPVAKQALERSLHVLIEKPMVIDPAHGNELVALAGRVRRELIVSFPLHFNPQALALREAIAAGEIGSLEHVSVIYSSIVRELYAGNPDRYRGEVFDYPVNAPAAQTYGDAAEAGGGQGQSQVSHAAGLMLWLTGLRVAEVAAFTSSFELPVDLADAVAIRFEGDALATLGSTGAITPGNEEIVRLDLTGREGHIVFDVNRGVAQLHRRGGLEREYPVPAPAERYPERAPAENLIEVALGRDQNRSPGEVGLATAELIAALYRSAGEGRIVRLGR